MRMKPDPCNCVTVDDHEIVCNPKIFFLFLFFG